MSAVPQSQPAWLSWREPLRARWRALGARERRGVAIAAALVGLALLWFVALQPALRTLRSAPATIDALDAQLQQMQRQAAEVRELRATPPLPAGQSAAALKVASDKLGERGRLVVLGDRATLTLTNATPEQLRRWLAEARASARARPLEATLARGAQGYSGTVVVVLPTGGAR